MYFILATSINISQSFCFNRLKCVALLLLSFIMPNGSTEKNTIIYTKYKNTFTKLNIKTDYKLKLWFILC